MRHILTILLMMSISASLAQSVLITDPDFDQSNPLDCSVFNNGLVTNFFDDGGTTAAYSPSFDDTIVLCPDLVNGSKVTLSLGINAGYSWDVDSTDTLYVWDGPSVISPFYGAHNSTTDPNGFSHQASFYNNSSGCLTVAFKSDGLQEGTGWEANISCGNPPQPFEPHMRAFLNGPGGDTLFPTDTGMIKACIGDSILYVGSADFPFSLENTGTGYSQTDTNVTYKWFFSNGESATGDSVWFTPPNQAGYVVTLQVTDQFPNTEQLVSVVRVGPRIDVSGTRALVDSTCQGDTVTLIAGIDGNDTVGVSPTVAETEVGGSFAGLTYLPDGSGSNYEADIQISGFEQGQTIQSPTDILRLSITIEHSYLGDLEMMLSCPNGDSVVIFNSYGGQGLGPAFAGGFGGGGTYLGDAYDNNIGNPGVGWNYNFSDTLADWGTMATEYGNGNTLPTVISSGNAMNPDSIYLPEQTFGDLLGCPINGTWTITVRDNLSIDDGYIFDWAIFFNPYINPNFQSYSSSLVDAKWYDGDSTSFPIIGTLGDTIIQDVPDSSGYSYYTFEVEDDFGCISDTTIRVYQTAKPLPISLDTGTCENEITLEVNESDSTIWSALFSSSGHINFSPNNQDTIVTVATDSLASYLIGVEMFKNNCSFFDTVELHFYDDIPEDLFNDTLGCFGDTFRIVPATDELNATYEWAPGGEVSRTLVVEESGVYYLTVTGCNTSSDSIDVEFYRKPRIIASNVVCDSNDTVSLSKSSLGGGWIFFDNSEIDKAQVDILDLGKQLILSSEERGFVAIGYFDSVCADVDTVSMLFEWNPTGSIIDSLICFKDRPLALIARPTNKGNYAFNWSEGSNDSTLLVYQEGTYDVDISNECGSVTAVSEVKFKDCSYFNPNIITPNGDGINDYFDLVNYQYYDKIELRIYNRWGMLLFEGRGGNARWNGHLPNGELVTPGTYFYNIVIDGTTENGSVTVLYGE